MFVLILLWFVNLGISLLNSFGCAAAWAESKAVGGWQRFVVWCGAGMAVIGFTWCYVLVFVGVLAGFGVFGPDDVNLALSASYVMLVPPLIGIGLVITIDSWVVAFRRGGFLNYGVAVWNTWAQVHNTLSAINNFGEAFGTVAKGLGDVAGKLNKGKDGWKAVLAFFVVVFSLGLGVLTVWFIIHRFSGAFALPKDVTRRLEEEQHGGGRLHSPK
jgi:hypothetical protein